MEGDITDLEGMVSSYKNSLEELIDNGTSDFLVEENADIRILKELGRGFEEKIGQLSGRQEIVSDLDSTSDLPTVQQYEQEGDGKLDSRLQEIQDKLNEHDRLINQERDNKQKFENELENSIDDFNRQREKLEQKIDQAEKLETELKITKEEINQLRQDTSNLVKERTGEALGDVFAQRKLELETSMKRWMLASGLAILLLTGTAVAIYLDITSGTQQSTVLLSKVVLIIPISVGVWFAVSNYSRQRKLMQQYEFKSNIAVSLRGFREVLQDSSSDAGEELVAEFVLESMDKIYSDPQSNINSTEEQSQQSGPPVTPSQQSRSLIEELRKF